MYKSEKILQGVAHTPVNQISKKKHMLNNQAGLYRVNKLTTGKDLWYQSYKEVQAQKLQVRIELYRIIHMEAMESNETVSDIWSRIKDIREVSDVWAVNQDGELSCFYVNEEYP